MRKEIIILGLRWSKALLKDHVLHHHLPDLTALHRDPAAPWALFSLCPVSGWANEGGRLVLDVILCHVLF